MSHRVDLHPAYILHTRAYRDTSLLVDILTLEYGKMTLVVKGARRAKNKERHLLQPFIPLLISWQGKSSLKTLVGIEAQNYISITQRLNGANLYSAMYVNELLTYLLADDNPSDTIYADYQEVLTALHDEAVDIEYCLRCFEFTLLDELGYGINFFTDANSHLEINADKQYYFIQQHGFVEVDNNIHDIVFTGQTLLDIQQKNFSRKETRRSAKYLTREAFSPLLKGRQLKSRELFSTAIVNSTGVNSRPKPKIVE